MQDTQQIVELWKHAKQQGTSVCLATVVHVHGSSYSKAGARIHRTKRLLASVAPSIRLSEEECLARLHAPVGLDIGSGDPATIALSIIAEIHAELMGKTVSIRSA